MCTAIALKSKNFYFGRTLDYTSSFGEKVCITPRNYSFNLRSMGIMERHYAIIGMSHISDSYPLYYDAANEKGLCIAGLNFVGNAFYRDLAPYKDNIAQFELIPWILGKCGTVDEAVKLLGRINITNIPYNNSLPLAELHWLIADKSKSVTVESVRSGLKIYPNPTGVLTNNPTFPEQLFSLNNYMYLSPKQPENKFCKKIPLYNYSNGMGAIGMPGDFSSQSRFIRACFVKSNSVDDDTERGCVNQFFHILDTVKQPMGCTITENGAEYTLYSSCINADSGIYYYTTYHNRQIIAVNMKKEDLDGNSLIIYPLDS